MQLSSSELGDTFQKPQIQHIAKKYTFFLIRYDYTSSEVKYQGIFFVLPLKPLILLSLHNFLQNKMFRKIRKNIFFCENPEGIKINGGRGNTEKKTL